MLLGSLFGALLCLNTLAAERSSPVFDYRMNCEGCHAKGGVGVEPNVPALQANLAPFLHTPTGREYLIRVPGVRQVSISDARIAELLNYVVLSFGKLGDVETFQPFTEAEVSEHRKRPYLDVPAARQRALDAYESY